MNALADTVFKGSWRSYKTFYRSGEVKQHSENHYQEYLFEEGSLLSVYVCNNGNNKKTVDRENWQLLLENKKHYLQIPKKNLKWEVITINHVTLVLMYPETDEKLFFSRQKAWSNFIQNISKSAL